MNEEVLKLFKYLFGEDFELKGISERDDEILWVDKDNLDDKKIGNILTCITSQDIYYDINTKVLYVFRTEERFSSKRVFMKARTSAWGFKYIFYPWYYENWDGWWNTYQFTVHEKELGKTRYRKIKTIKLDTE